MFCYIFPVIFLLLELPEPYQVFLFTIVVMIYLNLLTSIYFLNQIVELLMGTKLQQNPCHWILPQLLGRMETKHVVLDVLARSLFVYFYHLGFVYFYHLIFALLFIGFCCRKNGGSLWILSQALFPM